MAHVAVLHYVFWAIHILSKQLKMINRLIESLCSLNILQQDSAIDGK